MRNKFVECVRFDIPIKGPRITQIGNISARSVFDRNRNRKQIIRFRRQRERVCHLQFARRQISDRYSGRGRAGERHQIEIVDTVIIVGRSRDTGFADTNTPAFAQAAV